MRYLNSSVHVHVLQRVSRGRSGFNPCSLRGHTVQKSNIFPASSPSINCRPKPETFSQRRTRTSTRLQRRPRCSHSRPCTSGTSSEQKRHLLGRAETSQSITGIPSTDAAPLHHVDDMFRIFKRYVSTFLSTAPPPFTLISHTASRGVNFRRRAPDNSGVHVAAILGVCTCALKVQV